MNSRISDDIEERAHRRRRGRKSEQRKSTRKAHRPSQIATAAARVLPVEPYRVSPGECVEFAREPPGTESQPQDKKRQSLSREIEC